MKSFKEEYTKIIGEYFNMYDDLTVNILANINESDQNQVIESLTAKLYDAIVKKYADIDYGNIPGTRGDITAVDNYDDLIDTCNLMREIVVHYNQNPDSVDMVLTAIDNIKSRKDVFRKGYNLNAQFPCMIYETITLSIVSSISYLISTCVEYIKYSDTSTFDISLDKVAYAKSKDYILFKNLSHFNKSCSNGDLDKSISFVFSTRKNKYSKGDSIAGTSILIGTVALISIIPFIREFIYYFYAAKQNVATYFEIQANLLQLNASNIQYRDDLDEATRNNITRKQMKLVDRFRKISNFFMVESKKYENKTFDELDRDDRKYNIDDVLSNIPDSYDIF